MDNSILLSRHLPLELYSLLLEKLEVFLFSGFSPEKEPFLPHEKLEISIVMFFLR